MMHSFSDCPNHTKRLSAGSILKPASIVAVLLLIASSARADAGFDPSRIVDKLLPVELIIEVEHDYPDYQFWFLTNSTWENVPLSPGHPYRTEVHRAWNQLSPLPVRAAKKTEPALAKPPDDALSSNVPIDIPRVPIYDSRDLIIQRYRLEITPTGELKLVLLETNSGDPWFKARWIGGSVLACIAIVWFGLWILRRLRGKSRGAGIEPNTSIG